MARNPDEFTATITVKVQRGYQGYWEIIRALNRSGKPWSLADVQGLTSGGTAIEPIRDYVRRLMRAEYVVPVGVIKGGASLFRLKNDQPEAPGLNRDGSPVKEMGLGQAQMWRSMKMMGTFDARSLAAHSSTADCRVGLDTAKNYMRHLERAGYLAIVAPAKSGGRNSKLAVYRLVPRMNTGPLAPQVQRSREFVWDANQKKVMGPEAGDGR